MAVSLITAAYCLTKQWKKSLFTDNTKGQGDTISA